MEEKWILKTMLPPMHLFKRY